MVDCILSDPGPWLQSAASTGRRGRLRRQARTAGSRRRSVMKARRILWLACLAVAAIFVTPALTRNAAAAASGDVDPKARPAPTKERPELAVYAAASLRDVLGELKAGIEKAANATVVFNLAGSNDLARQIMAADKADLFISADEAWMDKVSEA